MIFDILTIFPDLLVSPLNESIIKRARKQNKIRVNITNIRDYASDKHKTTDDRPFGGGEGMVMKPDVLKSALDSTERIGSSSRVILLSPQGQPLQQKKAEELSGCSQLVLICGRYEGVDERFVDNYVDEEISIGDYILTGGELAAMVLIDSVTRLLPGVLGCSLSAEKDTFSRHLLKHPQYTRPQTFEGQTVPDVLLSGNHKDIEHYRFIASVKRTLEKRPELLSLSTFSLEEQKLLKRYRLYDAIINNKEKDDHGR